MAVDLVLALTIIDLSTAATSLTVICGPTLLEDGEVVGDSWSGLYGFVVVWFGDCVPPFLDGLFPMGQMVVVGGMGGVVVGMGDGDGGGCGEGKGVVFLE